MTDYRVFGVGLERPMAYGRDTGEEFVAVRLQVGKRANLEVIRLDAAEALLLASQLIDSVRRATS